MDLESLVAHTAEAVGALITKPKMAPKLLSKPPFRFLHDVISAITQTTGFGEGLMSGEELDSGSITDKAAKIAYLEKVVNFVGVCSVRACVRVVLPQCTPVLCWRCKDSSHQIPARLPPPLPHPYTSM